MSGESKSIRRASEVCLIIFGISFLTLIFVTVPSYDERNPLAEFEGKTAMSDPLSWGNLGVVILFGWLTYVTEKAERKLKRTEE